MNKKQKYFSLPDHQRAENRFLFLACKKEQEEDKSKFVTTSI